MFDRLFSALWAAIAARRGAFAGAVAALTVLSAIALNWVEFDDDFEVMLPRDEVVLRSMRFLRQAEIGGKVLVSLELTDQTRGVPDLVDAADSLAASLEPPLIAHVATGPGAGVGPADVAALLRNMPELLGARDLDAAARSLDREQIQNAVRRIYRQMISPGSTFALPVSRIDPLGMARGYLESVQHVSASLGYNLRVIDGHFISADERHALLILDTPVPITDGDGGRALSQYLNGKMALLPNHVRALVVAGHQHTISNEDVLKSDVQRVMIAASAGFLLLFLFLFRDVRAMVLFLLPFSAVLICAVLSAFAFGKVSYMVLAMGSVILGIADDFGIHVYVAVRHGIERSDAIRRIAKPEVAGGLATMAVFTALFFSDIPGYHQLAFFAITSIGLCLVYALFVLPHALVPRGASADSPTASRGTGRRSRLDLAIAALWTGVLVFGAFQVTGFEVNCDFRQFDGSRREVFETESRFHAIWGGASQPAAIIASGATLEQALVRNEALRDELAAAIGDERVTSIASIWPSEKTRSENAERWRKFWTSEKAALTAGELNTAGAHQGFAGDAFAPFLEIVSTQERPSEMMSHENAPVVSSMLSRFITHVDGGWQVLSFVPDEDDVIDRITPVVDGHSGSFVVSPRTFTRAITASLSHEIVFMAGIASVLILFLTHLLLRDIRLTALALLPLLTASAAILTLPTILGIAISAPAVVAALVVIGLSNDYGIFMVHACEHGMHHGTRAAITLSTLTTLAGAGVLLFAEHPVLYSIGVTLVTGLLAAFAASICVVPAIFRLRGLGRS